MNTLQIEYEFKSMLLRRSREFGQYLLDYRYVTILLFLEVNYPDNKAEHEQVATEIWDHPKYKFVQV